MSTKKIETTLNVMSWLCMIFNGLLVAFMIYSIHIGGLFFLFGRADTRVVSGSMLPKIEINDTVTVSQVYKNDKIEIFMPGDNDDKGIYVYRDEGHYNNGKPMLIIHRWIGITEDGKYIFKGDANSTRDELPVDKDHIIAKYEKINKFIPTTTIYCFLLFSGQMIVIETVSFILKRKLKKDQYCESDKDIWGSV